MCDQDGYKHKGVEETPKRCLDRHDSGCHNTSDITYAYKMIHTTMTVDCVFYTIASK